MRRLDAARAGFVVGVVGLVHVLAAILISGSSAAAAVDAVITSN